MLGSLDQVATGQESQLFENYIRGLYERWREELEFPDSAEYRRHGISSYINEEQFFACIRRFAVSIYENVFVAKAGASVFLEKSPNNSLNAELILRCFPEAKFIHVIRDGRDVAASMLAARSGWGKIWAPRYGGRAAIEWRDAVRSSRRLRDLTERYIEVRYEDLLNRGEAELRRVVDFLGLAIDDEQISDIYTRFSFNKLQAGKYDRQVFLNPGEARASGTEDKPEPPGFFRKGVAGDWVNSLSKADVEEIYWVAGTLLAELGYCDSDPTPTRMPGTLRRRQRLERAKSAVRKLGGRLLGA